MLSDASCAEVHQVSYAAGIRVRTRLHPKGDERFCERSPSSREQLGARGAWNSFDQDAHARARTHTHTHTHTHTGVGSKLHTEIVEREKKRYSRLSLPAAPSLLARTLAPSHSPGRRYPGRRQKSCASPAAQGLRRSALTVHASRCIVGPLLHLQTHTAS